MRNPLYDWIGVAISFFIALIITLAAKRIADQRMDEATSTTLMVSNTEGIAVGREIQFEGSRMKVVAIKGNTLTVKRIEE